MDISKITISGKEYDIVDKASRDMLIKLNEPYLPYPSIKRDDVTSESVTVTDGFSIKNYPYFYFNSTNESRVLYTKAGNMILQNMVVLTEYLSNEIDDLEDGEVITIHYGA